MPPITTIPAARRDRLRACLAASLLSLFSAHLSAQSPDPMLDLVEWRGQQALRGELLVVFEHELSEPQRREIHVVLGAQASAAAGARIDRVTLPADADLDDWLARYAAQSGVVAAQPNLLVDAADSPPNDPKSSQQWALATVRAEQAWALADGDPDCVVAIIDSGVKRDHVDLDAHYAWGWDYYAGDPDPTDLDGHGTHCAGVAAAETDNGVGIAGAGFHCRFAAYRAGNSSFPTSALIASIDDAVAQGAHVLSMSWSSAYNNVVIKAALQDARDAGCVLVAAAGNDNTTSKRYPAAYPFVIAVASSAPDDTRSSFSNHGSWVSVAAPGQAITSTSKNGGYISMSGTSMACPLVAGLATLLYARLGGERSPDHAVAVRHALQDSAIDVGGWVSFGRVDFAAAVESLTSPGPASLSSLAPTEVTAAGGESLTLTGAGLLGTSSVQVGAVTLSEFSVLDDQTLQLSAPRLNALGPQTLRVLKAGAPSGALSLIVTDTHPPRLEQPESVGVGQTLRFLMGGRSLDQWLLLVSLTPHTIPFKGSALLYPFWVLSAGPLDGAGLAELSLTVPPSVAGLSIATQLVTLDAGFVGSSEVAELDFVP